MLACVIRQPRLQLLADEEVLLVANFTPVEILPEECLEISPSLTLTVRMLR